LQPGDDAAVHLADAAFGEVERGPDLLHGHLLEVVEDDNQPLGAGEALGDQVLDVLALDVGERVVLALVLDDVDLADVL
jgi:hypothetical protein